MSAPLKLAAFAAALAVLLGGGALAGAALGPDRDGERTADAGHAEMGEAPAAGHDDGTAPAADHAAGDEQAAGHGGGHDGAAAAPVRGLSVADGDLRLELATPELRAGRTGELRFRITGPGGRTVRDFDVEHTKRMHVIVVRRDLTGFQHVHPRQTADGGWAVPIRIDDPGSYRVFADFAHDGTASTLAADLRVDGAADLRPLPPPATVDRSGPFEVRLEAQDARAGREATLRFTVLRDGVPVHTEPYLGAGGHLVALREGDLAFLHVHPEEPGDDHGGEAQGHDDAIAFAATFPTEGRYRLFLQFKVDGRVHTVAYTQEVTA